MDREERLANQQPRRSWNRVIRWERREAGELSIVLVLVLERAVLSDDALKHRTRFAKNKSSALRKRWVEKRSLEDEDDDEDEYDMRLALLTLYGPNQP